jgi:hypothetical protein
MTTLEYRAVQMSTISVQLERAYFVRTSDVMSGAFPYAEPVVLIDAESVDRHPLCRGLEVVDTPGCPEDAPTLRAALPLFVVDMQLAWEYEAARPAAILRDLRSQR